MLYKRTLPPLLAVALLANACLGQTAAKPPAPDAGRLRAHVNYLASDKLEGRRTGTPGAQEAARYVAEEFRRLGLAPGGVGSVTFRRSGSKSVPVAAPGYFQPFPYVAGVELGKGNALSVTGGAQGSDPETLILRAGEDWMPLGFSSNAKVEDAPAVFAGYGITAAELNYDDYRAADAAGKVALALPGTPDGENPHGRFVRAGELRFKAAAARAAGALALVLVASEENFKDERLARLRYDNAGGDAGLPVVVISRQAAATLLGLGSAAQLAEFEKSFREAKSSAGSRAAGDAAAHGAAGGGTPLQGVRFRMTTDVVRSDAPAANVVGVLEGSDARLKSEVVVIGAHYDHLGRGGEGSLAAREGEVHHGADDNASGTAGLLELARLFSGERAKVRRTIVFVAFGGEEEGLVGSSFYVEHPARPLGQTVAMLNMDMIGRLRGDVLNVGGVGTASEWRGWVGEANRVLRSGVAADAHADGAARTGLFELRLGEDGYGPSDHSSFYARRVPVLFLFTGTHEDYHKPTDTADRINYEGLARVVAFARQIVEDLQAAEQRPTFAVARSEANSRSTSFRVSLGTVPSYADSSDGLKLDAVRDASPAAAAGLKAGDRIVKLAGRDVRNIYDYTQALSEMKAGQEYEVEVVRDGQRLTMKVTPVARK